jgi:hypothetical protein
MGNKPAIPSCPYKILDLNIVSHKLEEGKFTVYVIEVICDCGKWIVTRRYSEFVWLSDQVQNYLFQKSF